MSILYIVYTCALLQIKDSLTVVAGGSLAVLTTIYSVKESSDSQGSQDKYDGLHDSWGD